ncbi:ABC transporter permease [Fusobacteria bacterium ZRK30]|nr:ABC transporter permease [Fusobacteria bacterium ZRK30]
MLLGTIEQGLIFAIMALGLYISYKILDFPDLTVDGSFPMGASIAAILIMKEFNPILALGAAFIGGSLAGFITGYIHIKFKITNLLAGIIVMTGLYSVNLRIMGKSNIPLFGIDNIFSNRSNLFIILFIVLLSKFFLDYLLKTKFGFSLRALGDNETLIVSLGIDEKKLKIIGLMLANGLVALSGGILAQYQGFSDIAMGTGTIVTGLASIIIGESVLKKGKRLSVTTIVIIGSILYRFIILGSLKIGFNASDIKLITAILTVGIMAFKSKDLNSALKSRLGGVFQNAQN